MRSIYLIGPFKLTDVFVITGRWFTCALGLDPYGTPSTPYVVDHKLDGILGEEIQGSLCTLHCHLIGF